MCYKHRAYLLRFTGKIGHACEFNLNDYQEVESDISFVSLNAYVEYVHSFVNAKVNTDIQEVKKLL